MRTNKAFGFLVAGSFLVAGLLQAAGTVTNKRVHLGSYGLYSPVVIEEGGGKRLFVGGWASEGDPNAYLEAMTAGGDPDEHFGPDKIFTGPLGSTPEQTAASLKLAFAQKGYHVNDPTVIHPPSEPGVDRSGWLYMYFTMLDNKLAERCRKEGKRLVECTYVFEGHDVGLASSVDGGDSWTFRGIVVSAGGSGDGKGAWMPSAVVVDNEIWLYYSSGRQNFNQENIFRQKLKSNGHEKIGSADAVKLEGFRAGDLYANVEVAAIAGNEGYALTGNDGPQARLALFRSQDGLNFRPVESNLLGAQTNNVITPYLEGVSAQGAGLRLKLFWAVAMGHFELDSADIVAGGGGGTATSTATSTGTGTGTGTGTRTQTSTGTSTSTATENHDAERYAAGQAFVDAFQSLLNAKANGATGPQLQPFIDVCVAAQTNARNWGVPGVDAYVCQ